jgi:AGZA family xanthine/uracil permease-like MFS transporter
LDVAVTQDERRPAPAGGGSIAEYFKFAERGTNFTTEVKAGVTTFMVMAYILFLNPNILSNMFGPPGSPAAEAFKAPAAAATALVAGVMSIAMGLVANVPIALAAGLGINALVAFFLVLTLGLTPAGAMGVIVLEGIVVLLLVLVGLREAIMNAVPLALKKAIAVGIGLFILFIGFFDGGLIVGQAPPSPPVAFVFPTSAVLATTLAGLVITVVLFVRRIPGALLLSILITTVIAVFTGATSVPPNLIRAPEFSTLGQFNLLEVFTHLGPLVAILTIFSFMLTDFFDTMGTATAISDQAGLTDKEGRVPNTGRLLAVDSVAAIAGGAAGISSNTSYIESAAGVAEGGRTGLTSVVVGLLFLAAILLTPLATMVPFAATAPVLIVVGYLMVTQIRDIDFADVEEGFPALLALILMPLTFSITVGIGAGFVAYVLIKVVRGKIADIHPLLWVVAAAFLIYFAQSWLSVVIDPPPPAA